MSNRARIKTKKPKVRRAGYQPRKYTSFNIFTRVGQNLTVTSERPMTIDEALYHYQALSVSANE